MRLSRALASIALLAPLAVVVPMRGQYSVDKVVFQNAAPYTDAELLAVSGLHSGQLLAHDSLANAAQHLLDSGLFADAEVSLSGQGKARTVLVALKPIPSSGLLAVSVENLAWFTPDELTQGLRAHVPLYRGYAADAGSFPETIQTALQQMLSEKGITAPVSHMILEPTTRHPVRVIAFKIEDPAVRLGTVHLSISGPPGAAAELAPLVKTALSHAANASFNEGLSGVTVEDRLLAPARDTGYIAASLEAIERSVAPAEHGFVVTYTARLNTGGPYKVSAITWEPTPLYTDADFTRVAKLRPGDIANAAALTEIETPIAKAYLAQGYMDVYLRVNSALDTAAHTVAYTLHAVPGEQYRLHAVTAAGISPEARKAFDAAWTMKPGDLYSGLAVDAFLRKNIAQPVFRPYTISYQASADPETHLVDLTLTFTPNGSRAY